VPLVPHPAMHRDDVVVAAYGVAQRDLMITAVAEDAGHKGINPVSANVVVDGGQVDNIKPASAKLTSLTFTVTLAWGDNGPPWR
jgi:hypothetical protein